MSQGSPASFMAIPWCREYSMEKSPSKWAALSLNVLQVAEEGRIARKARNTRLLASFQWAIMSRDWVSGLFRMVIYMHAFHDECKFRDDRSRRPESGNYHDYNGTLQILQLNIRISEFPKVFLPCVCLCVFVCTALCNVATMNQEEFLLS